jgi:HEAT repeat protein
MSSLGIQEKVVDTLITMNSAIVNLRLYPPTNAMIIKTVDKLYETFMALFEDENSIIFAESDRNLLLSGEPLSQKYLGKPQVAIFLMLMINWGIKSLTFEKGLEKSELIPFLQTMAKKPDEVKAKGGLEQVIAEGKMPHILINQKIYIAKDQDQQIVASLQIKDEDIVKYITSEVPTAVLDTQKVREMAKDPEWISRIFQSGMQSINDGTISSAKLSEGMLHMLSTLDKITEHADRRKISHLLATYIADMDAELIALTLSQNIENLLDNRLFDDIMKKMSWETFEKVFEKIQHMADGIKTGDRVAYDRRIEAIEQTYRHVMSSDKGILLKIQIQEKQAREEEAKKKRISVIKETGSSIIHNLDVGTLDEDIAKSSPRVVQELFDEGENETADGIIERLSNKLLIDDATARAHATDALAKILENLPAEQKIHTMQSISGKIVDWLKYESVYTPALHTISTQLKDLAHTLIRTRQFSDCYPIVHVFHLIISDQIQKHDEIRSAASAALQEIASDEIVDILMEEIRANKDNLDKEPARIQTMLSEFSLNRFLEILQNSDDSSERVLVLNLIAEIGHRAAQIIIDKIDPNAPWYYLRNLVRLLGKIGKEEHARVLEPLLFHEDQRVQREALKGISNIGGTSRGKILLNALSKCDDLFKASVVATLGSLKYRNALHPLMDLFKAKLSVPDEVKFDLQEKICLALGNIGDKEALPFLTEISKQMSFLGFRSYSPTVKTAAVKAIGRIMSKEEQ